METTRTPTIYPVILAVPEADQKLKTRARVENLSHHARKALDISAEKYGVVVKNLLKDEYGAPLPFDGNYWSVTHKPAYVGGVIANKRIGIDIEKIRSCSPALFKKTASDAEWSLSNEDAFILFFRYWTAKESVLKALGAGIRGLAKCRVVHVLDTHHLIIDYQDNEWIIEHFFFNGHIASVVKYDGGVEWKLLS
ncbi:MAG: 4'-phosphopantetheinyl transferase superfamily protein [Desulfobacterales bacterium]|nr:MAG: 4'-phosphopantetheinyl transferase superfamily protein [Desulfobacterales bacterium]